VTGSGKTAAFILPILQSLLEKPQPFYAVVLSPTRELAEQTKKVFLALGSLISLRCALITGGHDMAQQKIAIGQKPHVIVATPGRLTDHLEKTKGFSLRNLKCLVLDEADRLLDLDFGPSIDKILNFIPRERNTYLFSATMSSKVDKLRRASLRDPVKVAVSENSYEKVKTLIQHFAFLPAKFKKVYLLHVLTQFVGRSTIVFVRLRQDALFIAAFLKCLGFNAVGTHGQLPQNVREAALNRFRERAKDILVTTDVIARGIDITGVDLIVNFDPPMDTMTYMHRVGRTARAGRSGRAITFVSENHIEQWLAIEKALGGRVPEYERWEVVQDEVLELRPRAEEAEYFARRERSDDRKERDKRKKVARATRGRRYEDDRDLEER
jgi:ATP-dependent RNA helicase DDX47/RRP3